MGRGRGRWRWDGNALNYFQEAEIGVSASCLLIIFFALSFVLLDDIYCPRSNDLDRFKYSHMREHLITICCQNLTNSKDCLWHKPKRFIKYNMDIQDKDGLNNDAPVAWDGTGLTSDQFSPDGS